MVRRNAFLDDRIGLKAFGVAHRRREMSRLFASGAYGTYYLLRSYADPAEGTVRAINSVFAVLCFKWHAEPRGALHRDPEQVCLVEKLLFGLSSLTAPMWSLVYGHDWALSRRCVHEG